MPRRSDGSLGRFDIVLIDEVHWGESAKMYRMLSRSQPIATVFVGLPATPRGRTSYKVVQPTLGLQDLVELGYLAEPWYKRFKATSGPWNAGVAAGDYDEPSLGTLARRQGRNRQIVDTFLDFNCGPTLIFACNIKHAEALAEMINGHPKSQRHGVRAAVEHSKLPEKERRKNRLKLARGKYKSWSMS